LTRRPGQFLPARAGCSEFAGARDASSHGSRLEYTAGARRADREDPEGSEVVRSSLAVDSMTVFGCTRLRSMGHSMDYMCHPVRRTGESGNVSPGDVPVRST
jgi:hypothetical protein